MWCVEEVELVPVELDFSSAGLGRRAATAVEAGGVRLANALELVCPESAVAQVEVCDCCGFAGCRPGGWVAFRRVGELVAWLPAWAEMAMGDWEASEYRPPGFLRTRGAPAFSRACWESLRARNRELPSLEDVPRIDSRECARLLQAEAPGRFLGEPLAEPRVQADLVLAVTEGEPAAEARAVECWLRELAAAAAHGARPGLRGRATDRALARPARRPELGRHRKRRRATGRPPGRVPGARARERAVGLIRPRFVEAVHMSAGVLPVLPPA